MVVRSGGAYNLLIAQNNEIIGFRLFAEITIKVGNNQPPTWQSWPSSITSFTKPSDDAILVNFWNFVIYTPSNKITQ